MLNARYHRRPDATTGVRDIRTVGIDSTFLGIGNLKKDKITCDVMLDAVL